MQQNSCHSTVQTAAKKCNDGDFFKTKNIHFTYLLAPYKVDVNAIKLKSKLYHAYVAYGLRIVNGASFLTQKELSTGTFQFGVEATWRSVLAWINKTGISSSTSLLPMWKKGLPFSWGLKETTPNIRKIAEVYPLLFWKRARWPPFLFHLFLNFTCIDLCLCKVSKLFSKSRTTLNYMH